MLAGDQLAIITNDHHGHRSHLASCDAWFRHQRHKQTTFFTFISNEHPHRLAFSHLFTAYLILPLANPNIKHEKIILTK